MLKELRRFGNNSGLSGQMTIWSKRGLNTPLAPHLVYCISLIISMPKGSLEKTHRNKFLGDFSQFEAFISNTRDNGFQRRVSLPPTHGKDFFFLHPDTHCSDHWSRWGSNPAVSESPSLRCSQWMTASLYVCLNFPETLYYLLKWAQAVKVRGLGATQDVRGCWWNFPARSLIYLCILSKWRKESSLLKQVASVISCLAPPSNPTLWVHSGKRQLTDAPSVSFGARCGQQCLRWPPMFPISSTPLE